MTQTLPFPSGTTNSPVRLEGGPAELVGTVDLKDFRDLIFSDEKIKIRHGNGYEHYTPSGNAPGVYQWVGRTKIAE
ncbi:DUF5988 family protein [Streptomyces sp. UH6]|uniref:DUF5988 family protein n=1 Tax=Streptomyces sp. UH6 TaxID=2748379 RepID=UPI0015D4C6FE|nr:DUF5988 family protein [Streptomyces sp. UH6]NYV76983.1 hypothetical protein [Streptomyces sp. UH6]